MAGCSNVFRHPLPLKRGIRSNYRLQLITMASSMVSPMPGIFGRSVPRLTGADL
jgi:hypothetical protein